MQEQEVVQKPKKTGRIKFIDVARSIAILLMLEGHFIEVVFDKFRPMVELVKTNKTSGNWLFDIWYFMKGFTAPMFFTVTGIVFVFLLVAKPEPGFINNSRIKSGFKRVLKLLFWGYFIQFNIQLIPKYIRGESYSYLLGFHVLQCIGIGILFLLLIYGLHKLIKVGHLSIYYFLFGTLIFGLYPTIKSIEGLYPLDAPQIIQNLIKGKFSIFPIIPWLGFTLYGGMLGSLIFTFKDKLKTYWFPLSFIIIGLISNKFGWDILNSIDNLFLKVFNMNPDFVTCSFITLRFGQIIIALGILMLIEKFFTIRDSLFMKIGQNTLPVYIIHVVILYGGIFGVGLSQYMKGSLNGYQSVIGAIIFIIVFIIFIKYFEFFDKIWKKTFGKIGL